MNSVKNCVMRWHSKGLRLPDARPNLKSDGLNWKRTLPSVFWYCVMAKKLLHRVLPLLWMLLSRRISQRQKPLPDAVRMAAHGYHNSTRHTSAANEMIRIHES